MADQPRLKALAKIYISAADSADRAAFGGGLIALLRGVQDAGSLNRAAKDMHMAYSKAWKLMNRAEDELGVKLIERNGARGSVLTDQGIRILRVFDTVSAKANAYADKILQEELKR